MNRFQYGLVRGLRSERIASNRIAGVKSAIVVRTAPLCCRTARSRTDLNNAFRLLGRRYAEVGLNGMGNSEIRIMPYHLSGDSQVFIAESAGEVVGTVTLVLGKQPLPAASSYPQAIARLERQTPGAVGEITSLAIDSRRVSQSDVFGQLSRLLTFFARAQRLEQLVAVVHPRHARFYQRVMGSTVIGDEMRCPSVGGRPGVALAGSVNDPSNYRDCWRQHYFDGEFSATELQPVPICAADNRHFRQFLVLPRTRQAA